LKSFEANTFEKKKSTLVEKDGTLREDLFCSRLHFLISGKCGSGLGVES
jgi:hypothetical protein